jgi:signal transduction histidine kinase
MDSAAQPLDRRPPQAAARAATTPPFSLDSGFESQPPDAILLLLRDNTRWMGWRLRLLIGAALLGCVGLFLLARTLGEPRQIDASWRADAKGRIALVRSDEPALRGFNGRTLESIRVAGVDVWFDDALALQRSARWLASDSDRASHRAQHEQLAAALAQDHVQLRFTDGSTAEVRPQPRGFAALSAMFLLICGMALSLYLVAMVVLLANPSLRNLIYALMALCQSGNLLFIAVETTMDFGLAERFPWLEMQARTGFDLITAAAIVHMTTLHPRRLPFGAAIAAVPWLVVCSLIALSLSDHLSHGWWWTQGSLLTCAVLGIALLGWSYRIEPHPYAIMLRRFGVVVAGTLALLTLAIAAAGDAPGLRHTIGAVGSLVWYVFFASLLLLTPFLSRSQQVMREFSLLAAISTVATSLDLLFVAVFSLGQFASLTLALFLSFGVYAGARQWILNHLLGNSMLTTERMFERLYRIARDVEAHPQNAAEQLSDLLRDLFEPLEVVIVDKPSSHTRVVANGSTLLVPLPDLAENGGALPRARSLAVRFAHRGRRLFNVEDARLTDRVVEQLLRAVAFDKAVEQGRNEERMRLAQDLHDDIGARLLTLMYKAQSAEMEDYVHHTLQDLKTLTRGLAAPAHRLSHAVGEWKADLTQRLAAAGCELQWSASFDDDVLLSVVQWSALTRVLRELISNVIAHAQAARVTVEFRMLGDGLELTVADDGIGRNPQAWAHGLGLGGVRKRVRQLGGDVEWSERQPSGIVCRVKVPELSRRW